MLGAIASPIPLHHAAASSMFITLTSIAAPLLWDAAIACE
jgi:hypothetical protein